MIVTENQNILDVVIQKFGSLQPLIQFCKDNDIELNHLLSNGDEVVINESNVDQKLISDFFTLKSLNVTTGDPDNIVTGDYNKDFNLDYSRIIRGGATIPDLLGDFSDDYNEDFLI